MKILVITPTYNEIENIEQHISNIDWVREQLKREFEIESLIVDDNSPDGTSVKVGNINFEWLHLIVRQSKNGLGEAYKTGFNWAKNSDFDYIVEMDADGSHRPGDLLNLITHNPEVDLVIGSRWILGGSTENWSRIRIHISKIGNLYARMMLKSNVFDSTSGFRRYNAKKLKDIDLSSSAAQGYAFQVEMVKLSEKEGFRIEEIPIKFIERTQGKSKMTLSIVFEAIWIVFKLRFKK